MQPHMGRCSGSVNKLYKAVKLVSLHVYHITSIKSPFTLWAIISPVRTIQSHLKRLRTYCSKYLIILQIGRPCLYAILCSVATCPRLRSPLLCPVIILFISRHPYHMTSVTLEWRHGVNNSHRLNAEDSPSFTATEVTFWISRNLSMNLRIDTYWTLIYWTLSGLKFI